MERLMVYPVDFFPNSTNPKDPILFEAVQKFCEREFGKRKNLQEVAKTWAAVRTSEQGEGYEVVGLTSIAYAIDCPLFHIKPGGDDAAAREYARHVREALLSRASSSIQDWVGVGTEVLVFVSATQERFWKGFLRMIGAKPANRWIVKV